MTQNPDHVEQFVRLFSLHQRKIYTYILTLLPHRADAEDVLQETSAILWKKFEEFRPDSNFIGWACRIARLEVLEFYRKRGKSPLVFRDSVLEAVAEEAADRTDELDARYHALGHCLGRMNETDRDLVERRYVENASVPAIAAEVGRPVEGLYKAYRRIRHSLLECIERQLRRNQDP